MEALQAAAVYTVASFLLVWPLLGLVEPGWRRTAVLVASVAGAVGGSFYAFVPAVSRVSLENVLIKGGTLWAGLCLLLAVLDVSGIAAVRRRHPWLHSTIIIYLAATALPLNGLALLRELRVIAFLKENASAWLWGAGGVLVTAAACLVVAKVLSRRGALKYATLWTYLLVAPAVRVALQPFIMANVESIIARVAHDAMHVLIMLVQLPDHVYLSDITWTVIGLSFLKTTGVLLNIALYLCVVIYVVFRQMAIPLPVREGESPPDRRRRWVRLKAQRRIAVAPVALAAVWLAWSGYAGWAAQSAPYTPIPTQLPPDGIEKAVLADGKIHSFSFGEENDKRAIAILRPDGSYSVCLDACLVCPPDGYAQLGPDLFCLYCGTPIPIDTVGQPGGCNPVPLEFIDSGDRLAFDQLLAEKAWEEANTGK